MVKKNVIFTLMTISVLAISFTGCKNSADDAFRAISKQGDDVIRKVDDVDNTVIQTTKTASKQSDDVLNRCRLQAKIAVNKSLVQASSSNFEISEDNLTQIAKDAAQKCAFGGFGDFVLDQLANDAVTEAKQEYQSEY
ncbi:hypothetical protein [Nostoc sp. FACHB-190]|uniref:hypothetical protein n=1 Tax=Nostoc sp. FACHB-190 TaxID=2692838 RepID=UPI0016866754|nr:hypothetical protein [Nostoc sp. FACHB-190]MBD2299066.1 hypothetical protein [Nostoc sp. FACHB-190]